MKKISINLEDVIIDMLEDLKKYYNEEHGLNLTTTQIIIYAITIAWKEIKAEDHSAII